MIKMVVFDMAGTTVDENLIVYKTLQAAINEAGFFITLKQVLAEGAGKEKRDAIRSILRVYTENQDKAIVKSIFQHFMVLLQTAYEDAEITEQPNALETFRALKDKGIFVVLNTGYNQPTAETLLAKLDWQKGVEFDGLITSSDVNKSRPAPDMILLAMKTFGIKDALEVIKIGDSIIDIEEGVNAGCRLSIGITTGAHTKAQLVTAHPHHIIDDLLELLPILEKVNEKAETI